MMPVVSEPAPEVPVSAHVPTLAAYEQLERRVQDVERRLAWLADLIDRRAG